MTKHPKLAKKLKLLYQLKARPDINSNRKLADLLGISRQSVSRWGTGGGTQSGDAIPDVHYFRVGQLFGIDSYLFTLEYEEFEKEVRMTLGRRNRSRLRWPRRIFHNDQPMTSERLLGREVELAFLNEAWDQCAANVIQVTGVAGVGKSRLINEWLEGMDACSYRGAETVFTWSFHNGSGARSNTAPFELFLSRAQSMLGDAVVVRDDSEGQVMRLVQAIRQSRTLLVLDGIQNLQYRHGSGFDQSANPAFSMLVRELAMENSGLCVLGSRRGNAEFDTISAPRAVSLELGNLSGVVPP